jgi:single-strand DNA-binding protein
MSYNKVILVGNMGNDVEASTTKSGLAVANGSLATSYGFGDKERTDWHRLTFWDKTADVAAEYLKKGTKCMVEGRISYDKYTDKEGVERQSTTINVDRLILLGRPAGEEAPAKKAEKPVKKAVGRKAAPMDEPDDMPF